MEEFGWLAYGPSEKTVVILHKYMRYRQSYLNGMRPLHYCYNLALTIVFVAPNWL